MNYLHIIIYGLTALAVFLIFVFLKDIKNPKTFASKNKNLNYVLIAFLFTISFIGLYTRFIEPNNLITKTQSINLSNIEQPIKVAFIADIQIGKYKKERWINKIIKETENIKPDLIIFGGDLISNEGTLNDVKYLDAFAVLTKNYPTYYILGNHEYGLGGMDTSPNKSTGDRSLETILQMNKIGAKLLKNNLECLNLNNQEICLFGIDDLWGGEINFKELKNWDKNTTLIYLTHNPDGISYWPKNIKKPDLVLSGHTHGGQIYLPIIGPLGNPDVELPKKYWRGLNYFEDIPLYTSCGAGESGANIRFLTPPSIDEIIIE